MGTQLEFSSRELPVIKCLSRGLLNKEIAFELGLTEGTVKEYVYLMKVRTGLNRTQLAIYGNRLMEVLAS